MTTSLTEADIANLRVILSLAAGTTWRGRATDPDSPLPEAWATEARRLYDLLHIIRHQLPKEGAE